MNQLSPCTALLRYLMKEDPILRSTYNEVRLYLVQSRRQDARAERCLAVRSPVAVGDGQAPAAALAPT